MKGWITALELPSLKGKLDNPLKLVELLQPLLSDILIITSGKKHTTLKFKNTINIYSKCNSRKEVVESTRQSILAKIQKGRAHGSYVICETSPSKLTQFIEWCGDHHFNYERTKYRFTIYLNDATVMIIEVNTIKTNSLENATISVIINLLRRLDFVEDVLIRHESMDPEVDQMIVSGLTRSPRRDCVEKDEEIQGQSVSPK